MRDLRLECPRSDLAKESLEASRLLEQSLQARLARRDGLDAKEAEKRAEVRDLVLERR